MNGLGRAGRHLEMFVCVLLSDKKGEMGRADCMHTKARRNCR